MQTASKIFERQMLKQIFDYINQYLSPLVYEYRKGFSTQTTFLYLIEKWRFMLDKNGHAGASDVSRPEVMGGGGRGWCRTTACLPTMVALNQLQ